MSAAVYAGAPPRPSFPLGASFGIAAVLHAVLVGALLATSLFHPASLLPPQAIHVQLARLGTPRDKRLLPRRPQEPASRPAAPVVVATAHALPVASTHHPKLTSRESRRPEELLRNALNKLQQQVDDDRTGQLDGFENGTAEATVGDLYWARVVDRIKRFYVVPNTIPQAERDKLVADVQISVAGDGTILEQQTQASSGNPVFDRAVEDAVKRCRAIPPPPPELAAQAREGVVLEFRSAEM